MNAAITPHFTFALITFAFQVYVRSYKCDAPSDCLLSYSKGAVWSLFWPASWAVYLPGITG